MKTNKTKTKSTDPHDIKDCYVSDVGLDGFAECQMSGPNSCPYAMPFGYGFLCRHPHVDEFIARNKKGQATAVPN